MCFYTHDRFPLSKNYDFPLMPCIWTFFLISIFIISIIQNIFSPYICIFYLQHLLFHFSHFFLQQLVITCRKRPSAALPVDLTGLDPTDVLPVHHPIFMQPPSRPLPHLPFNHLHIHFFSHYTSHNTLCYIVLSTCKWSFTALKPHSPSTSFHPRSCLRTSVSGETYIQFGPGYQCYIQTEIKLALTNLKHNLGIKSFTSIIKKIIYYKSNKVPWFLILFFYFHF